MKKPLLFLALLTLLVSSAFKNTQSNGNTNKIAQHTANTLSTKVKTANAITLYVLAPNGLSLRKENTLDSEKLTVMPRGSAVQLLEAAPTTDIEIEHIQGGMHKVHYQGQIGYAFSGFLSPFELMEEHGNINEYINHLKEKYPSLSYESVPNGPDFHEGYTETFTLPAKHWHEAYYAVAALAYVPKTLGFPKPYGPVEETIEDPNKPEETWASDLIITRKENTLEKIVYGYRTEGFGASVTLTRQADAVFKVSYLRFVD